MGDPRVLLGKKGSEYGLWVSKVGQDVTTAGSDNLLFDSSKAEGSGIIKSGTLSITVGTTANTTYYSSYVNYTDGSDLNYIPLVMIWNGVYSYPLRLARRIVLIESGGGGRGGGNTYYHQLDANGLHVEALAAKFRLVSKYFGTVGHCHTPSGTFRYAVLAIGGSTITSVGP